jgi:hypothetical protein
MHRIRIRNTDLLGIHVYIFSFITYFSLIRRTQCWKCAAKRPELGEEKAETGGTGALLDTPPGGSIGRGGVGGVGRGRGTSVRGALLDTPPGGVGRGRGETSGGLLDTPPPSLRGGFTDARGRGEPFGRGGGGVAQRGQGMALRGRGGGGFAASHIGQETEGEEEEDETVMGNNFNGMSGERGRGGNVPFGRGSFGGRQMGHQGPATAFGRGGGNQMGPGSMGMATGNAFGRGGGMNSEGFGRGGKQFGGSRGFVANQDSDEMSAGGDGGVYNGRGRGFAASTNQGGRSRWAAQEKKKGEKDPMAGIPTKDNANLVPLGSNVKTVKEQTFHKRSTKFRHLTGNETKMSEFVPKSAPTFLFNSGEQILVLIKTIYSLQDKFGNDSKTFCGFVFKMISERFSLCF